MGLTRWLLTGERGGISQRSLRGQLATSWGFPASTFLEERARAQWSGPVIPPNVGETLLVSVRVEALWHLGSERGPMALELRGSAAASAELSRRLVTRDLPLYDDPNRLHRSRAFVARPFVIPRAEAPPATLDGASYGLSLSLAIASDMLRLPLPPDLAATGVLHADGTISPVDGLARKVALILEHAPGIHRFFVPGPQLDEACEAVKETLFDLGISHDRGWLSIQPVGTFGEAFTLAWPDAIDRLRERWQDREVASRLAEQLHRVALFDSPVVLGWPAIETCAEELMARNPEDRDRQRLALVRAIARRHNGHKEPHPWPSDSDLAQQPRAARLRHVAHVVQSEAEGGEDPGGSADRALRLVRRRLERASEDAVLLGAVGRAFGAADRDEDAISALREAIATWQDIGSPADSTHALCELLRLLGVAGRAAEIDVITRRDLPLIETDPRMSDKSLGFVRVALGRAYVQVGRPEEGFRELSEAPEGRALPLIAEAGRLRWLSRAHDALGRPNEADAVRDRLSSKQAPPYPWELQTGLALLDAARRDGRATPPLRERLSRLRELGRSLERCPEGRDWAAHLTERSRY